MTDTPEPRTIFRLSDVIMIAPPQPGLETITRQLLQEFGTGAITIAAIKPVKGKGCRCAEEALCTCEAGKDLIRGVNHPQWLDIVGQDGTTGQHISGAFFQLLPQAVA